MSNEVYNKALHISLLVASIVVGQKLVANNPRYIGSSVPDEVSIKG